MSASVHPHPDRWFKVGTRADSSQPEKGTELFQILSGDRDVRDLGTLDNYLKPIGKGLEESKIRAVVGKSGDVLRALMVPSQLCYWCIEYDYPADVLADSGVEPAERACMEKHARKPLKCCGQFLVECQNATFVCVGHLPPNEDGTEGDFCGQKFYDNVAEIPYSKIPECTKCGGKDKIKKCIGARYLCRKFECNFQMFEDTFRCGHCCKGHGILDLSNSPYVCKECRTTYSRPGIKCCGKEVTDHERWICPNCHMEYPHENMETMECGGCDAALIRGGSSKHVCLKCWPEPGGTSRARRRSLILEPEPGKKYATELEVRQEDIGYLDDQNLVDVENKVDVRIKSLPASFKASWACDLKVLTTLADKGNDALLRTKLAQAVTSIAWMQFRLHTAFDIFLNLFVVFALMYCSFEIRFEQTPIGWIIFLIVVHSKRTIEEVQQWLMNCAEQERRRKMKKVLADVFELENFADLLYMINGWVALIRRLTLEPGVDPWMAFFCTWNWLKLLYSLRGELWIGPRLLPIFFALRDAAGFFFVVFVAVGAASHCYYELQLRIDAAEVVEGQWFRPLFEAYTAVLQTSRLGIWGDFDLYEFEGLDPSFEPRNDSSGILDPADPAPSEVYLFAHLLFFATGVGITVLLMNLLIGILGADFERYEEKSAELFSRARAKMMKEIGSRPSTLALQSLWMWWLKLASMNQQSELRGAAKCVPLLLRGAALPLQLVLGPDGFRVLVLRPLEPFVRHAGSSVTILAVLLSPAIFVLSLTTLILSCIPALVLRNVALRHLLSGGLGLRTGGEHGTAWFASQCGIVVFTGGDEGYNGARKSHDKTQTELDDLKKQNEKMVKSLEHITNYLQHLPVAERPASPPRPPTETFGGSDIEEWRSSVDMMRKRQDEMDVRLENLHYGLDLATDKLNWACDVLWSINRRFEIMDTAGPHRPLEFPGELPRVEVAPAYGPQRRIPVYEDRPRSPISAQIELR